MTLHSIPSPITLQWAFHDIHSILSIFEHNLKLIHTQSLSFSDESKLQTETWSFKTDEVNLESLGDDLIHSVTYDPDTCKVFFKNHHIILYNDQETLTIHYNDSTITIIYHNNGEY